MSKRKRASRAQGGHKARKRTVTDYPNLEDISSGPAVCHDPCGKQHPHYRAQGCEPDISSKAADPDDLYIGDKNTRMMDEWYEADDPPEYRADYPKAGEIVEWG